MYPSSTKLRFAIETKTDFGIYKDTVTQWHENVGMDVQTKLIYNQNTIDIV